jgi:3-deoxy-D-manno-octulosonic acid kinase
MLITNPACPEVSGNWLEPGWWGSQARPVSAGGRGSAWFVDTRQGEMVLRQYRRGGLIARLSERRYVFTGWHRTRSYREYQLLRQLYDQGLPVPEPIAAGATRYGLFYEAAILIRRIPGAVPLPEVDNLTDESLWREVGRTIRRFHDAGLDHVDLNCDNILVAGGVVYLIDFDRCRVVASQKYNYRNLDRLARSVERRINVTKRQQNDLWNALIHGYHLGR